MLKDKTKQYKCKKPINHKLNNCWMHIYMLMRYSIRLVSNYIKTSYIYCEKRNKKQKREKKTVQHKTMGEDSKLLSRTHFSIYVDMKHTSRTHFRVEKGDEEWVISHRVQWSSNVFHCIINMVASLNKLNFRDRIARSFITPVSYVAFFSCTSCKHQIDYLLHL